MNRYIPRPRSHDSGQSAEADGDGEGEGDAEADGDYDGLESREADGMNEDDLFNGMGGNDFDDDGMGVGPLGYESP
jgi:hypothetical protein